jgi:tetratricopeptide (TPR) repeat protein
MNKRKLIEYVVLIAVLLSVFGVYLGTMHPVFKENDSPETVTAAYTLGIAHPPGYPLYGLMGKMFITFIPGNPAFRVNILSSFLMVFTLLITYLLLGRISFKLFGSSNNFVLMSSLILLAFSFLVWDQSIEAKGGIYILNMFFLSILIYSSFQLLERFNTRMLYFLSFIFGLGLSNHWPSMIILTPVLGYVLLKNANAIKLKMIIVCFFLLAVGVSPYIYLPIRAAAGPPLKWGNTIDFTTVLRHILRQDYIVPQVPGTGLLIYQVQEFIKVFVTNYSFFCLLILPGMYIYYKKAKNLFFLLAAIFIITSGLVVLYNRTKLDVIWLMDIFLIPAEYIALLLISAGAAYIINLLKKREYIYIFTAVLAGVFIFMVKNNWDANNCSRDFLEYDYAYNIQKTLKPGAYFLGDGEYNTMPFYYICNVEKKDSRSRYLTYLYLDYNWGIGTFKKESGLQVPMEPGHNYQNAINLISYLSSSGNIYRSSKFPDFDNAKFLYGQQPDGITIRFGNPENKYYPVFDLYSYRGIFEKFVSIKKSYTYLMALYPICMVNQANRLEDIGYYKEGIDLYLNALEFPIKLPNELIYYNISIAYKNLKDTDNEYNYLIKAAKIGGNILPVYERLAIIFYDRGQAANAYRAAQAAVKYRTVNGEVIRIYDETGKTYKPNQTY